jgi:amino acid adenylation domain-containing protein/non-ribosomal peptide synthase protein (TIGR01720 family)
MHKITEVLRASLQQEHLWFIEKDDESTAYRSQCSVIIEGTFDLALLKSALYDVVSRHEILRTRLRRSLGNSTLVQIITDSVSFSLDESDLSDRDAREQEIEVDRLFDEMGRIRFDHDEGNLLRAHLLRLSETRHMLLMVIPALYGDATSLENLVRDLSHAYGERSGHAEESEGPIQYADFADWQREILDSEVASAGKRYWNKQDIYELTSLDLPLRKSAEECSYFEPATLPIYLEPDLTAKAEEVARAYETTTQSLYFSAWIVLLWRHTKRPKMVIGVRSDGRKYAELEGAFGLFAKYLPARVELDHRARFSEVLREAQAIIDETDLWQEAFKWREGVRTEIDREPFCAVSFEVKREPARYRLGESKLRINRMYERVDRFELKLRCLESREKWRVELDYDARIYGEAYLERLGDQYRRLLRSIVENPETEIDELQMLSESEWEALVVRLNQTETEFERGGTIHELIARQNVSRSESIAVAHKEEHLSYEELNRRANRLGRYLRKLGVGGDTTVGLFMERGLGMIVGLLGVLKAGGAYVPLDPKYPSDRLAYLIKDARAVVLLTEQRPAAGLPQNSAKVIRLDTDWNKIEQEEDLDIGADVNPQSLVYVIYTSGSTGQPKGVAVEHRQLVNYSNSIVKSLSAAPGQKHANLSTLAADLGNTAIFPALISGGCLHLIPQELLLDGEMLGEYFGESEIDYLKITPTHLASLHGSAKENYLMPHNTLIIGGEASTTKWVRQLKWKSPNCMIMNHYGPTETTVGALTYKVKDTRDIESVGANIPLGRPLANVLVYILDEKLRVVPVGVSGEIFIGGQGVSRGYMNQCGLTGERFLPDQFARDTGSRLYRTGDQARYLPDGRIEYLGRLDHQVKIKGFRIELGEIEAILDQHLHVRKSVVLARENPFGDKRLVAYLEVDGFQQPAVEQLRNYLEDKLPEFMVPSVWVFLDSLPLTSNGKLDRRALPAPDWSQSSLKGNFVAPETENQRRLAEIWSQTLGLERVGIHDNFFKLGGDSILSIQIISRARQAGYQLTARDVFQHQTIAELAAVVDSELKLKAEQGLVTGEVPLTPIQERFFESDFAEPFHYNQSIWLEVKQAASASVFETALRCLLRHHDALRLRYHREDGKWKQLNAEPEEELPFVEVDLSGLSEPIRKGIMEKLDHQLQRSFNLQQGPLVRMTAFDLGAESGMNLSIIAHHLVVDVVSWSILLEDLERACDQIERGRPIDFPAKTTSYQQWAEQLKQYAGSKEMVEEAERWMKEVGVQAKSLPVDDEFGENREESSRTVEVTLNKNETETLLQKVSQRYQSQIERALLDALRQGFSSWMGKCRVLVDVERHGREEMFREVDVSRTVGWFTTIHPVVLECGEEEEESRGIKPIKEVLRNEEKQGINYGVLRYLSEVGGVSKKMRELDRAEVSFNYLGQLDNVLEGSRLKIVEEKSGMRISGKEERRYSLSVTGRVRDKRLQLEWSYNEKKHKRETIERLGERFKGALQAMINNWQEEREESYTPQDFPEAGLSQEQIDLLLAKYGEEVESIATS